MNPVHTSQAKPQDLVSAQSPSLRGGRGDRAPAFELKFLLSEAQAAELADRTAQQLTADPFGDPAEGGAYRTTTVYCDTPGLDVFHALGKGRRQKHRMRCYGDGPVAFLERKVRRQDRVRKRRCAVPRTELPLLSVPLTDAGWAGAWFHGQLWRRGLAPVCRIAYDRVARIGGSADDPLRLTFDRNIRGVMSNAWDCDPVTGGVEVLTDRVLCEFKFLHHLPALFRQLMEAMQLQPVQVSKYRSVLRAAGAGGTGRDDA